VIYFYKKLLVMEKPTGVIQKIIESLQQINALNTYSPIEKDIILHNLRAAYMIFLNLSEEEHSTENRIEKLFEVGSEQNAVCDEEPIIEEPIIEEQILEEETFEEEPLVDEQTSVEEIFEEEPFADEQISVEETFEEEPFVDEQTSVEEIIPESAQIAQNVVLHDDILEFIPDAKPQSHLLFDDGEIPKPEKKSLNDLLTEKKDDNSLGAHFQQSFIPDLTKAIGINEKFTFIRELFHNSGVDFSNAIQKLNECENIDSAFVLMEELKHQYIWDTTSSSYLSLCDLVRRRFI
jgi:hypothetical protein